MKLQIRRTLTISVSGERAEVDGVMERLTLAVATVSTDGLHSRFEHQTDLLDEDGTVIPASRLLEILHNREGK